MDDVLKIQWGGQELWLSSSRCMWWPTAKTLICADLHFGKGIDFWNRGSLLPPHDFIDTIVRLTDLMETVEVKRVICLGDNFHRSFSFGHLQISEQKAINNLVAKVPEWIWVMGNHDPELPAELLGMKTLEVKDHHLLFYHQHQRELAGQFQIIGHYHPKHTIKIQRLHLTKPCFAWNQNILIMPSFGSYTGGLAVEHSEISKILGQAFTVALTDLESKPTVFKIISYGPS